MKAWLGKEREFMASMPALGTGVRPAGGPGLAEGWDPASRGWGRGRGRPGDVLGGDFDQQPAEMASALFEVAEINPPSYLCAVASELLLLSEKTGVEGPALTQACLPAAPTFCPPPGRAV